MGWYESSCDACGSEFDEADVDSTGHPMIQRYEHLEQTLCVRCAREAHEIAAEIMKEDVEMEVDLGGEG